MIKKAIAAFTAVSAALTFCGCRTDESAESTADDNISAVSSAVSNESIFADTSSEENDESRTEDISSADSSDADSSAAETSKESKAEDSSADNIKQEEKPTGTSSSADEKQPDTELPIVPDDDTDTSQEKEGETAPETSEKEQTSSLPDETVHGSFDIELPIMPVEAR